MRAARGLNLRASLKEVINRVKSAGTAVLALGCAFLPVVCATLSPKQLVAVALMHTHHGHNKRRD
jgi:hypothetical protein